MNVLWLNGGLVAAEAFPTNSLIGVCPLVTLDGHTIGAGTVGPVTLALKSAYEKASAP